MKKQTIVLAALCATCFLFYRCNTPAGNPTAATDSSSGNDMYHGYSSQADWGKHLVTVGGCGDCHTPKKMGAHGPEDDSSLLLSGHPAQMPVASISKEELAKGIAATTDLTGWVGPWGTSYAANITPDSTGIGAWSAEQFITCIRQGVYKGLPNSRPIMPPMPVNSFKNFSDDELKAIFAYLKTVQPVHNVVPEYQPPAGPTQQ